MKIIEHGAKWMLTTGGDIIEARGQTGSPHLERLRKYIYWGKIGNRPDLKIQLTIPKSMVPCSLGSAALPTG